MSFSALLTAVADYVHATLIDDCGRPEPTRVYRYHNTPPVDCCTDDGLLSVHWTLENPTVKFPSASGNDPNPCSARMMATILVRYVVCWDEPEAGTSGLVLNDVQYAKWDADAAMLADVADCVSRALLRLQCDPDVDDPFVAAVLAQTSRNHFRYVDTVPIANLGGCTGVQWRCYSGVALGVEPS